MPGLRAKKRWTPNAPANQARVSSRNRSIHIALSPGSVPFRWASLIRLSWTARIVAFVARSSVAGEASAAPWPIPVAGASASPQASKEPRPRSNRYRRRMTVPSARVRHGGRLHPTLNDFRCIAIHFRPDLAVSACFRLCPPSPCSLLGSHGHGRRDGHEAGYPREEPGAGKPHARICDGESRMAELLDHDCAPPAPGGRRPAGLAMSEPAFTACIHAIVPAGIRRIESLFHRPFQSEEASRQPPVELCEARGAVRLEGVGDPPVFHFAKPAAEFGAGPAGPSESRTNGENCYPCIRSVVSPIYPVAQEPRPPRRRRRAAGGRGSAPGLRGRALRGPAASVW